MPVFELLLYVHIKASFINEITQYLIVQYKHIEIFHTDTAEKIFHFLIYIHLYKHKYIRMFVYENESFQYPNTIPFLHKIM